MLYRFHDAVYNAVVAEMKVEAVSSFVQILLNHNKCILCYHYCSRDVRHIFLLVHR